MKLSWNGERWKIGNRELHCGEQVKIELPLVGGETGFVYGRFEICGSNNPVFITATGRIIPDLQLMEFLP